MTPVLALGGLLATSASRYPERNAVEDVEGRTLTYLNLDQQSNILAARLRDIGILPGDRVGVYAPKSLATVVAIFSVLKTGAAYVPVDPYAPAPRNAFILEDCVVKAVLIDVTMSAALQAACPDVRFDEMDSAVDIPMSGGRLCILMPSWSNSGREQLPVEGLAYILYTSGSTGKPKGVMHSHATALSFLDWSSAEFKPDEHDRFSSHAPFHFDLSILDLYLPIRHGACVVLIGEEVGKQPLRLAPLIDERAITVWYSTPSILRLLVEFGHLDQYRYTHLRLVLFAGEVFPVKHLRSLQKLWPNPRYCNLYGPTETNVCTWHEAPPLIPEDRIEALPIGRTCSGDRALVVNEQDVPVNPGEAGELLISGGSVMLGYWNLPEMNAKAFHIAADGTRWYRTGDVVREDPKEGYIYLGRRDRMVKRRGYRVELGEIESALYRHPRVTEAAVIALPDEDSGVQIRAFLALEGSERPSLIALKRFAAENLPAYMAPDRFIILDSLPKTSTDKVDYQRLKEVV